VEKITCAEAARRAGVSTATVSRIATRLGLGVRIGGKLAGLMAADVATIKAEAKATGRPAKAEAKEETKPTPPAVAAPKRGKRTAAARVATMQKVTQKEIGRIPVDSGKVMVCDPCYVNVPEHRITLDGGDDGLHPVYEITIDGARYLAVRMGDPAADAVRKAWSERLQREGN